MSTPETSRATRWQQAWDDAQPALEDIRTRLASNTFVAPRKVRVGQLDAELLDLELVTLLKEPIKKSISLLKSTWAARHDSELTLIIQAILYKFSVWDTGATYGAKLQDLSFKRGPKQPGVRYAPSELSQKVLLIHASLTILVPYIHSRMRDRGLSESWPDAPRSDVRRRMWDNLVRLETLHSTFALIGFITFLWDGRYRTLTDRLLGLKLVPSRRVVARNVNYEFMNRQMVWHAFTEFLLFILPLVNFRILRRRLGRAIANFSVPSVLPSSISHLMGYSIPSDSTSDPTTQTRGKYFDLPEDWCAVCAENVDYASGSSSMSPKSTTNITNKPSDAPLDDQPRFPINVPYITSCSHVYCYFCAADRMMRAADDGEKWDCLRCDTTVASLDRVDGRGEESGEEDDDFSSVTSGDYSSSLSTPE